jgi:uncharacterized membrane protein YcaP (DUF421 family)
MSWTDSAALIGKTKLLTLWAVEFGTKSLILMNAFDASVLWVPFRVFVEITKLNSRQMDDDGDEEATVIITDDKQNIKKKRMLDSS